MVVDPNNAAQSEIALGDVDEENDGTDGAADARAAKLLRAALRKDTSGDDAKQVGRDAARPAPTMWR
jgi:hypothetical protein